MKYTDKNPPLVCMQTNSTCYKGTGKMTVKGVLWHSTGANNPYLKRYVQPSDDAPDKAQMLKLLGVNVNKNDWNHINYQAGLNCWIGKLEDGTVTTVQTMPWDYRPWGCGKGSRGSCNEGWVQFEICEDALTDKNYFETVYQEACQLTAYLCKKYNINPTGSVSFNGVSVPTILCHADSYKLGLGTGHADVEHWFSKHGKTMATVRNDVQRIMTQPEEEEIDMTKAEVTTMVQNLIKESNPTYETINDVPASYKATIQKLVTKGILKGYGGGKLNLSEDMCRILTILDREGQFK